MRISDKKYPKILNEGLATEKRKRLSLLLGHDSMNDLAKARDFPIPASKIASTFVLALIEEKSTPLSFLYFST